MKKLYSIAISIILLLGVGHTLMTLVLYSAFSADMLWFAGTGLALICLGLLNVIALQTKLSWVFLIVILANVIATLYLTAVSLAVPEIQAYLATVAAGMMAVTSILTWLQNKNTAAHALS